MKLIFCMKYQPSDVSEPLTNNLKSAHINHDATPIVTMTFTTQTFNETKQSVFFFTVIHIGLLLMAKREDIKVHDLCKLIFYCGVP